VACEPAEVDAGMGLTEPVQAALPHAVRAVREILAGPTGEAPGEPEAGQQQMVTDSAER
jgi:hypothetical protein